jgi:hypothetical protein
MRQRISRSAALTLLCLGTLAPAPSVRAQSESELLDIIHRLEERVEQLETRDQDKDAQPAYEAKALEYQQKDFEKGASWADRVRLSGSAETGWFGGGADSVQPNEEFEIWDSRFFVEAELARDVKLAETTLVRDVGFMFEWDLVRLGSLQNRVGELYVDFQGIGEQDWANAQVGRFQIPVGENYLRFSQGYRNNPFISNTVGGPWYWDEGVRAYGHLGKIGWVTSVSDGETSFNFDPNTDKQFTVKLYTDPTPWLHLSVSGLRSGVMGSGGSAALGALWLGETFARPIGAGTTVPTFENGVAIADGQNRLKDSWLAGGDVIFHFQDIARLWLGGGWYRIEAEGGNQYNRDLAYWIAELVVEGAAAAPVLAPFYVGLRANGIGTYNSTEGYSLDMRQNANIGYNAKSLEAYTTVLGWRLTDDITLRAEYSINDVGVVRGVTNAIRENAKDQDTYGVAIGVAF